MAELRVGTPEETAFLEELEAAELLIPSGVPGIYGRGSVFEDVRTAVEDLVTRHAVDDAPETLRFPPVLPRRALEDTGYLRSFPHLGASIFGFEGSERDALELAERADAHEDWSGLQGQTDLVLTPAACYPVYPAIARRGPLPEGGIAVDAGGAYVFRNEPSGDPARLQMFHQKELVRIGEPDVVAEWRDKWRDRAITMLRGLGLEAEFDVATDPFFGRSGRMLAVSQREQALKFEVLVPIASPEPTAVASFNYHQEHFAEVHGLTLADGGVAHTACLGFGLERVALALLRRHGLDPAAWPDAVRQELLVIPLHGHDPASYVPHAVHRDPRNYPETNCYTDTLVELLHGHGLEPLAGLGHLVRTDFEGDQFTFFKMPQQDLENGFGVDIHEMQPVGALPAQIAAQIEQGRTMTVELDSFFLPDVAATDYRRNHVKTTVAVEAIDLDGERLHYFHNLGLHELSGEDYRGVFHLDGAPPELLPPYLELVRFDVAAPVPDFARDALHHHLRFLPEENPFESFGRQLEADLPRLLEGDLEDFHAYAFATVRMAGAAFELLQAHVVWLLGEPVDALDRIVEGTKVLSFRLARRRAFDPAPAVEGMAEAWAEAMAALGAVPA